jgi:hypothetical protein
MTPMIAIVLALSTSLLLTLLDAEPVVAAIVVLLALIARAAPFGPVRSERRHRLRPVQGRETHP